MTGKQTKKENNGSEMSKVYYPRDYERPFFTGLSGVFPDEFRLVGPVASSCLDDIWRMCNDFGDSTPFSKSERSMCIGDVVSLVDGSHWILTNEHGWTPIKEGQQSVVWERRIRHC